MQLNEWKHYVMSESGAAEGIAALKQLSVTVAKDVGGVKWQASIHGMDHFVKAMVPRSKIKSVYGKTVAAIRARLKDSGQKFSEHPSRGDILEDESASTRFVCKGGSIHVATEIDSEDDRKFEISVFVSKV